MNVRRVLGVALVVAMSPVLASATSASATVGAAATKAPDGYVTKAVKAAGITIAIPTTWIALDPKSPSAVSILQSAADKNPKLGSLVDQFKTIRSSIKFWAIDAGATTFAANVLVLPTIYDKSIVKKPATIEAALRSALGNAVDSLSAHTRKVAGSTAVEADGTLEITGIDGTRGTAYATVFFVSTKQGVVDIDYTSGTPRDSDTVLQTMIETLRTS